MKLLHFLLIFPTLIFAKGDPAWHDCGIKSPYSLFGIKDANIGPLPLSPGKIANILIAGYSGEKSSTKFFNTTDWPIESGKLNITLSFKDKGYWAALTTQNYGTN